MRTLLHILSGILMSTILAVADTEPNDACTQVELISALDGTVSDQIATMSGDVSSGNNVDYYGFTPNASGVLTLTTSSPNNQNFRLKIGSSCNGTEYYGQLSAKTHTVSPITVTAGSAVYLRIRRDTANSNYQLNFTFTAATVASTIPEPKTDQCGIFPSVLTAYDTIAFNGGGGLGSATSVLNSAAIAATNVTPSNPPSTGEITCDGAECSVENPLVIDYGIPAYASADTSTLAISADTEITALDTPNFLIGSPGATQPTLTFSPSATYAGGSTRKVMKIASLDSMNRSGIRYIFNEGDYYIGSWYHRGNDLTVEVNGNVRIFLDGILQFEGNELHINETGLASQLFVFGKSDFIFPNSGSANYNVHAFFYTKGNFTLDANSNTGNGFVGGITAEINIALNNNQTFEYDPSGLENAGFDACGWCESNNKTSSGFFMVPFSDAGVDRSFELFCDASDPGDIKDLIALPIKNDANNFVFTSDSVSSNYYSNAANPRTPFHAIEINANTWKVKTKGGTTGAYNIMGSSFSNINLLGTPFAVDWTHTTLSNCTDAKLRKAYHGQAVKINTLDYDKATCSVESMQIKLLDDYRHLVYSGQEVLEKTCKEMAEFIPDNLGILDDTSVKGHFWIDPFDQNRAQSSDIGADGRPVVAYCWYQPDLDYVWTFLLSLDAKVTVSKNDLTNKQDTCSEFGLNFFVPNTKDTFNRVRNFLLENKNEWDGYTGTIDEKINALYANNHYYIPAERSVTIWPYGPFGVYYPSNGTSAWRGANDGVRGAMSGSPMHNIPSNSNYNESMGRKGWVSILGSQDLNKTNTWWIDDMDAGERLDCSLGGCTANKYYEPNGNYTANAWLNFLYDAQGWVYHNDDWNNNYPYYDYMCMAEDNYDNASRYSLVPGLFTVVDSGHAISDTNITTKIVNKPVSFDLLLYEFNGTSGEIDRSRLETAANKSVGVFLSSVVNSASSEVSYPVKFLGEYNDFIAAGGRITLPNFTANSATKKALVSFYYCDAADADWKSCWNYNNMPDSPVVGSLGGGSESDSYDFFAIRPDAFSFTTTGGASIKAGNSVDIAFQALDYTGQRTNNYNETQNSSFGVDVNISDPAKVCDLPLISINPEVTFSDGENNYTDYRFFEVGEFTLTVAEDAGAEFASIDSGDTAEADRLITPFTTLIKIIPDHFDIRYDFRNFGNGFTYLSRDLNMSSTLEINITAKRLGDPANPADANITRNYTADCYAKDFDLTVTHADVPAPLSKILVLDNNSSVISEIPAAAAVNLPNLPSTRFIQEDKGMAALSMRINFDRNPTKAMNPFAFVLQEISSTDTDGASGSVPADQNATYYYGRNHAPRYRIEGNTGSVALYYEVYCRACDPSLMLPIAPNMRLSVDDIAWFVNENHTLNDGEVTAVSERSLTNEITETYQTHNSFSFTYNESRGYPFKAMMQTTAPSWLVYSRFNEAATNNDFMIEFNSQGVWSGKDAGTQTVAPTANINTSRRIEW